jgi:hypothetical protein
MNKMASVLLGAILAGAVFGAGWLARGLADDTWGVGPAGPSAQSFESVGVAPTPIAVPDGCIVQTFGDTDDRTVITEHVLTVDARSQVWFYDGQMIGIRRPSVGDVSTLALRPGSDYPQHGTVLPAGRYLLRVGSTSSLLVCDSALVPSDEPPVSEYLESYEG